MGFFSIFADKKIPPQVRNKTTNNTQKYSKCHKLYDQFAAGTEFESETNFSNYCQSKHKRQNTNFNVQYQLARVLLNNTG